MYLSDLHIDRFGIFRDQGLIGLEGGLTVFLGANESGKSTLLELVRWVLFGPASPAALLPQAGSGARARLRLVRQDGTVVLVERAEGEPSPPHEVFDGLDRRGFERIFALGLDDLQGFQILNEEEQTSRLQSAGQGLGRTDLGVIRRSLEKEIRSSLTQRGTRAEINQTRRELEVLEESLRQARDLAARYETLAEERQALDRAEEERAGHLTALAEELSTAESLHLAEEPWKRWQDAEERLRQLSKRSPGRTKSSLRPPEATALGGSLVIPILAVVLYAFGIVPLAGAGALALAGACLGGSLLFLMRSGHQRMNRAHQAQQLNLEAQRHRAAFEALTERDPRLQRDVSSLNEEGLAQRIRLLREEQNRVQQEARQAQQRLGAIIGEMASLRAGTGPEEILLDQQIQKRRLEKGVRRWATAALSLDILDAALHSYTEERMPRILSRASELVSSMVGEKLRLVTEPGESPHLEASSLARRSPQAWSSGLGDQTYLAMRLAFAEELRRGREHFPFLLDDVFVRLDPQRQSKTLRCLLDLSSSRQILLFTSRPSLLEDLKKLLSDDSLANPSAYVVKVQKGTFSGPFKAQDCD